MRSELPFVALLAGSAHAQSTSLNTVVNTIVSFAASGSSLNTVIETVVSPVAASASEVSYPTTVQTDTLVTATASVNDITATATLTSVETPFPEAPGFVQVASSGGQLSTLLSVLQQDRFSDLLSRLTSSASIFTCLAPTDAAFEEFLATENGQRFQDDDEYATALLEYHVMLGIIDAAGFQGDGLLGSEWYRTFLYQPDATPFVDSYVGGYTAEDNAVKIVSGYLDTATVQQANINFKGGYIHIIDHVLTVPPTLEDLLNTANFTSLLGAFTKAQIPEPLLNDVNDIERPTVFAPTNEAFQNIGSALGNLSVADIANILMYHVVMTPAFASDLTDGQQLETLGGGALTVTIRDGDDGPLVFINGARVVLPDLAISGGVVHGIDQVLDPRATQAPPEGATSGVAGFGDPQPLGSPPLTSGVPTPTTTIMMPGATGYSNGSGQGYMPEQQTGAGTALGMSGAILLGAIAVGAAI